MAQALQRRHTELRFRCDDGQRRSAIRILGRITYATSSFGRFRLQGRQHPYLARTTHKSLITGFSFPRKWHDYVREFLRRSLLAQGFEGDEGMMDPVSKPRAQMKARPVMDVDELCVRLLPEDGFSPTWVLAGPRTRRSWRPSPILLN